MIDRLTLRNTVTYDRQKTWSKRLSHVVVPKTMMIWGHPCRWTSFCHRRMPFIICYSDLQQTKRTLPMGLRHTKNTDLKPAVELQNHKQKCDSGQIKFVLTSSKKPKTKWLLHKRQCSACWISAGAHLAQVKKSNINKSIYKSLHLKLRIASCKFCAWKSSCRFCSHAHNSQWTWMSKKAAINTLPKLLKQKHSAEIQVKNTPHLDKVCRKTIQTWPPNFSNLNFGLRYSSLPIGTEITLGITKACNTSDQHGCKLASSGKHVRLCNGTINGTLDHWLQGCIANQLGKMLVLLKCLLCNIVTTFQHGRISTWRTV